MTLEYCEGKMIAYVVADSCAAANSRKTVRLRMWCGCGFGKIVGENIEAELEGRNLWSAHCDLNDGTEDYLVMATTTLGTHRLCRDTKAGDEPSGLL